MLLFVLNNIRRNSCLQYTRKLFNEKKTCIFSYQKPQGLIPRGLYISESICRVIVSYSFSCLVSPSGKCFSSFLLLLSFVFLPPPIHYVLILKTSNYFLSIRILTIYQRVSRIICIIYHLSVCT